MEMANNISSISEPGLLRNVQDILQSVQTETRHLAAVVARLDERVTLLAEPKITSEVANDLPQASGGTCFSSSPVDQPPNHDVNLEISLPTNKLAGVDAFGRAPTQHQSSLGRNPNLGLTAKSRIILTTYPGQSGIHPVAMNWGHADPIQRGPVLVSRDQCTVRRRNGTRFRTVCHE